MDQISSTCHETLPVALLKFGPNPDLSLEAAVEKLFVAADFKISSGASVLVKPNLLKATPLACTPPDIVAICCQKLLDLGAKVRVSDSPGFGTCVGVAKTIGLSEALEPLGLKVTPFGEMVWQTFDLYGSKARLPVAKAAFEADLIFSMPRVKAHSQMRLTMAVKNSYGLVGGAHKAIAHTIYGKDSSFFSDLVVALWASLPKVYTLIDGRIAMHITGPANGKPYNLNLLAACQNAALLDLVLARVLQVDFASLPLGQALQKRLGTALDLDKVSYPLEAPKDFNVQGFRVPQILLTTSFAPHRLIISCLRRLWAALIG